MGIKKLGLRWPGFLYFRKNLTYARPVDIGVHSLWKNQT